MSWGSTMAAMIFKRHATAWAVFDVNIEIPVFAQARPVDARWRSGGRVLRVIVANSMGIGGRAWNNLGP